MANKTLKFRRDLADLILAGTKDSTWRLFDDKDISTGDVVDLLVWQTLEQFASAKILEVREKPMQDLEESDFVGHERFANQEAMMETYAAYYQRPVTADTLVKIIRFRLLPTSAHEQLGKMDTV